jgi:thiol-disulfide isomerase/thioredoxin
LITILILLLAAPLFSSKKVEDFVLEDIDGNSVRLYDVLQETPVLLGFWASWCSPCMNELPVLHEIQTKFDTLLTVLCVNIDNPRSIPQAKSLVKSKRVSFITLFDTNSEVSKKFNIRSIPKTFIINQDAEIIYEHTGYRRGDEKELEKIILEMTSKKESLPNRKEEKALKDTLKIIPKVDSEVDITDDSK